MTRNANYKKNPKAYKELLNAHKDLLKAYKTSYENELLVKKSSKCGCFYCGKIFDSSEIIDWVPDRYADTAICPYCGIDSILPDSAGYPLTKEFLVKLHRRGFGKLPMDYI